MELARAHVLVCGGTGCTSSGSEKIISKFESCIAENGLSEEIKVIRTGLHSGGDVEGEFVAGAYHPAFKEICESKIYLRKVTELIRENKIPEGKIEIRVSPKAVSQMTGQKKANIEALKTLGYEAKITADESIEKYKVYILRNETL